MIKIGDNSVPKEVSRIMLSWSSSKKGNKKNPFSPLLLSQLSYKKKLLSKYYITQYYPKSKSIIR
jgi:hypothetical protein